MITVDSYFRNFLEHRPNMVRNAKQVLTKEIKTGERILDVGAGPGVLAEMLEEVMAGTVIYGIESHPLFHQYGVELSNRLKKNRYLPINSDIRVADLHEMPLVDIVCFMRSLHEVSTSLENRVTVVDGLRKFAKPNAKVIISDPFYVAEVHERPREYEDQVAAAQEYLQRTLGHSHPPEELPLPERLKKLFHEKLQDIEVLTFDDELTEATGIIKTYWLVGRYVSFPAEAIEDSSDNSRLR